MLRKLFGKQLHFCKELEREGVVAAVDLRAKLCNPLTATLLDIISCFGLLFLNLQMLLAKDIRGESLLDVVDALARKVRLLRS